VSCGSNGSYSLFARVHVSGPYRGRVDMFVENLPGFPDNIRPSSGGGYWVALSTVRPNPGFSVLDFLAPRPWLKKLVFKVGLLGHSDQWTNTSLLSKTSRSSLCNS